MRFAEKSFEIRFCAALSAAIMPFNRNPQWFGMTQAQERRSGIDTMIRMGGRLLVFQFKAMYGDKFVLDKAQWETLSRVSACHANSTYYVFPEFATTLEVGQADCVLKKSWLCNASNMGPAFNASAKTASAKINSILSSLVRSRPQSSIPLKRSCDIFGCFCPPRNRLICWEVGPPGNVIFRLEPGGQWLGGSATQPIMPFRDQLSGIFLGEKNSEGKWGNRVRSAEDFEELLGDKKNKNLEQGLYGLFLPDE